MYDAIIVLGAGVTPEGLLEENSRCRVDCAIQHFRAGEAPVMLCSGAWSMSLRQPPAKSEALAMKEYAITQGCPAEKLLIEEKSFDTFGNAFFVKRDFAKPLGWKKMLFVVAEYHVWRTQKICQLVFGPGFEIVVVGAELPLTPEERQHRVVREQASWEVLRELFTMANGDDAAIEHALFELHPAYSEHPRYTKAALGAMIAERVKSIERL